jgi:hypothetical protein
MKKITFIIIAILCTIQMMAQTPNAFKYQAVARTTDGLAIDNQNISVQISILESASVIYTEEHALTTNAGGLFSLNIGEGISSLGDFQTIDWSMGSYSVEVALDENAGSDYTVMGTSPLLTVPYAMHAKTAENVFSGDYQELVNTPDMSNYDTDVTDDFSGEYDDLNGAPSIPVNTSDLNNDSGFITNADDADADASNELQNLSLTGTILSIENGNSVDLSGIDTDTQLSEAQVDAYVSDNGYITSADDADADASNELQDLTLTGTTLSIENGNSVNLSALQDGFEANTDEQSLSITGNDISISGANTISLPQTYITNKYMGSGNSVAINDISWTEVKSSGTFVKQYENSILEIIFVGGVKLQTASDYTYIEVRIDDNPSQNSNLRTTVYNSHGTDIHRVTLTGFESSYGTGSHTIKIYAKTRTGNDAIIINPGGYDGSKIIIKEYFGDYTYSW